MAVISKNAEDLLDLITQGKNIENQYYYIALKAHYDKLLKLKYPSKSEGYDSFDGFMVVKSNPKKDKQFAFINKFFPSSFINIYLPFLAKLATTFLNDINSCFIYYKDNFTYWLK